MSNEIKIFNNTKFGNIRVQKDEDGEPLFCLADVCRALEISDTSNVSRQIISEFGCPVLKTGHIQDSLGRIQEANFITEQQLYFVMNRSDKPNAKPFRMWVNTEVLPSIRKTDGTKLMPLEPVTNTLIYKEKPSQETAPVFNISGLRHYEEGDKIWFCLVDIGRMLELSDATMRSMKTRDWFDGDELNSVANCNGGSNLTYVSESALYRIINRSNSPKARPFERWVTKEVLPSIRKHGMYATPVTIENMIADPDFAISLLNTLKEERIARKQAEEAKVIAEKERDVYSDMVDDVMQDEHTYTATEIAKDLGLSSAKALNKWLVDIGFFYKSGKSYLPYSKYSKQGFTSHKLYDTGHGFNVKTIKFTNAGKIWIIEKWKAQHQLLLGL